MTEPIQGVRVRGLLADGAVRLLLVEARGLAEHTRVTHGLGPDAARLGADAVVAAALLGAHIKGDEQITLQLQGSEPRCAVYVDMTSAGVLRARITPSDLHLGPGGTSTGIMVAVKHVGDSELYRGISEIDASTVEAALGEHLGTSTQVDAVLRIGVQLGADGSVLQAGGLLVERLPEEPDQPSIDPQSFEARYAWIRDAPADQVLTQLAFGSLGDDRLRVLESTPLEWRCRCSRERIEVTLKSLGPATLSEMIEEDGGAEVRCNFCETVYQLDEARLRELAATS